MPHPPPAGNHPPGQGDHYPDSGEHAGRTGPAGPGEAGAFDQPKCPGLSQPPGASPGWAKHAGADPAARPYCRGGQRRSWGARQRSAPHGAGRRAPHLPVFCQSGVPGRGDYRGDPPADGRDRAGARPADAGGVLGQCVPRAGKRPSPPSPASRS